MRLLKRLRKSAELAALLEWVDLAVPKNDAADADKVLEFQADVPRVPQRTVLLIPDANPEMSAELHCAAVANKHMVN